MNLFLWYCFFAYAFSIFRTWQLLNTNEDFKEIADNECGRLALVLVVLLAPLTVPLAIVYKCYSLLGFSD